MPKLNIAVFSAAALFFIGPPEQLIRRHAVQLCQGQQVHGAGVGGAVLPLGDGLPAHPQGLRYELLGHLAPGPVGPEDLPQGPLDGGGLLPLLGGAQILPQGPEHVPEQYAEQRRQDQGDQQRDAADNSNLSIWHHKENSSY